MMRRFDLRLRRLELQAEAQEDHRRQAHVTDTAGVFPPGWWADFLRVCRHELPEYGISILHALGVDEADA